MRQTRFPYRKLLAAALVAAPLAWPQLSHAAFLNGVAAGDTTPTSTILWTRTSAVGPVRFEISEQSDFSASRIVRSGVPTARVPVKVAVDGLKPGTQYFYRAIDLSGASYGGQFRTPAVGETTAGLTFGVTGDARPELLPYPGVRNAVAADLDFFVCLGDCIYAEDYSTGSKTAVTLSEYRAKYATTLTRRHGINALQGIRQSTSTYAMIDDHEVINDFSGGAQPATDDRFDQNAALINETLRYWSGIQAFHEYMPIADETYGDTGAARDAGKTKLYRARTFGKDAMFALVDARSFRDQGLPGVANLSDPAQVGAFLVAAFDPTRTMLGAKQLADLKADLLAAQTDGILWKFVMVPEPIQNLGVLGASDRFEGYAAERTSLLKFIHDNAIHNVVFVTADIHGTLVNNLSYQVGPGQPQIATDAFEISTGPVAFDAPFGPTVADLAVGAGLMTQVQKAFYDSLPVNNDADDLPNDKDDFVKSVVNAQLQPLGYDTLGLAGSLVDATLLAGDYFAGHTYGWTAFAIDGASKKLTVTTYGVPAYDHAMLKSAPATIASYKPQVVSRFQVTPK